MEGNFLSLFPTNRCGGVGRVIKPLSVSSLLLLGICLRLMDRLTAENWAENNEQSLLHSFVESQLLILPHFLRSSLNVT